MADFYDHEDGLWKQSVPLEGGRLLSPHNPGLSVLLAPGFALGGLVGAQVQLLVTAAATMTMAFLLSERLTAHRQLSRLATLGAGLTATPFIYSPEIFPEFPAALALLGCLLAVIVRRRLSVTDGIAVVAGLSMSCWLGVKYFPLALLVAGYSCGGATGGYGRCLSSWARFRRGRMPGSTWQSMRASRHTT